MTWRNLLALGIVSAGVATACTVTTNDQGGDASMGTGGSTHTGGSTSTGGGGASTGGGGASTGGGGAGTGGSTGYTCDPSKYDAGADPCQLCLETKCCTEWKACGSDSACAGTTGEFYKYHSCMVDHYTTNGGTLSNADRTACAAQAATSGPLSFASQDIITCQSGNQTDASAPSCAIECFNTVIGP